jgi:hypothetical protein
MDDTSKNVREMVLSLDFSAYSIQGLTRLFEDPIQGAKDIARSISWIGNARGYNDWLIHEADGLADATRSGLNLFRNSMEQTFEEGVKSGAERLVPGLRQLGEHQFGRAIPMWKYQSWKYNTQLLEATKNAKGFEKALRTAGFTHRLDSKTTMNEFKRIAADHVNNAYGGLSESKIGRGSFQKSFEKFLILTPDFLRATLGVAASATRGGAEGYLARHLLLKGAAMAGTGVYLASILENQFNPLAPEPNMTNPNHSNWLFIKVGDRMLNPFGRYRTLLKTVFTGPLSVLNTQDFSSEKAAKDTYEGVLRFARGRTSVPVGMAIEQMTSSDYFGNPIVTHEGKGEILDRVQSLTKSILPIGVQDLWENAEDGGIKKAIRPDNLFFGALGMSTFTIPPAETNVMQALAKQAVAQGVPLEAVRDEINRGRNPLYAAGEDNKVILSAEQREDAFNTVEADTSIDMETLHRVGRSERLLSVKQQKERDAQMKQSFYDANDTVKSIYSEGLQKLESAVARGDSDFATYSRNLTDLRAAKRAGYRLIHSDGAGYGDVALAVQERKLHDPNATDALYGTFGAALNNPAFRYIGVDGAEEWDFDQRDAVELLLRQQYGDDEIDDYITYSNRNKSDLELDRDHAFQDTLRDYFDLSQEAWTQVGGTQYAPTFQDFERGGDPNLVSSSPLTRRYNDILRKMRENLRFQDTEVEQAVIKWLGLNPIVGRRRR